MEIVQTSHPFFVITFIRMRKRKDAKRRINMQGIKESEKEKEIPEIFVMGRSKSAMMKARIASTDGR